MTETTCVGTCQWRGAKPALPACSSFEATIDLCPTDRCNKDLTAKTCLPKDTTPVVDPIANACASMTTEALCPVATC